MTIDWDNPDLSRRLLRKQYEAVVKSCNQYRELYEKERSINDALRVDKGVLTQERDCAKIEISSLNDLLSSLAHKASYKDEALRCRWQHKDCTECSTTMDFVGQGLYVCWKCAYTDLKRRTDNLSEAARKFECADCGSPTANGGLCPTCEKFGPFEATEDLTKGSG